eukprot:scaffold43894_cov17-Tisochrysis_lutea.AAC.1
MGSFHSDCLRTLFFCQYPVKRVGWISSSSEQLAGCVSGRTARNLIQHRKGQRKTWKTEGTGKERASYQAAPPPWWDWTPGTGLNQSQSAKLPCLHHFRAYKSSRPGVPVSQVASQTHCQCQR